MMRHTAPLTAPRPASYVIGEDLLRWWHFVTHTNVLEYTLGLLAAKGACFKDPDSCPFI